MMLRDALQAELKKALLAKESLTSGTIRLVLAALKDRDLANRAKSLPPLEEAEILSMLQGMIKQRRDSMALYEQGGRIDLAEREQEEIVIIQKFLPSQLSPEEIEAAIDQAIEALSPSGLKDMGKVMAQLRGDYAGKLDFQVAAGLLKEKLGQLGTS